MHLASGSNKHTVAAAGKDALECFGARDDDHRGKRNNQTTQNPRGVVVDEKDAFNSLLLCGAERVYHRLAKRGSLLTPAAATRASPPDGLLARVLVVHTKTPNQRVAGARERSK